MNKDEQPTHPIELIAEVHALFSMIEEVYIPDVEKQLQEIREACKSGWEVLQELLDQLKEREEAGS